MKTFTTTEKAIIKSSAKAGRTQYQIARSLHTRKQNVASYLAKIGEGKRAPGTATFWKDVKATQKLGEYEHKEAIRVVKMMPKWLKKRVAKLSKAEQIFHEEWANLDKEMRAAKFMEGRPEGMVDRLYEDYEDYWETP